MPSKNIQRLTLRAVRAVEGAQPQGPTVLGSSLPLPPRPHGKWRAMIWSELYSNGGLCTPGKDERDWQWSRSSDRRDEEELRNLKEIWEAESTGPDARWVWGEQGLDRCSHPCLEDPGGCEGCRSRRQWATIKKPANDKCLRRCREKGTFLHCQGDSDYTGGKQRGGSSKRLKTELPYDPANLLLCIYQEKTILLKDICTPKFIAALFTIARTWKQLMEE